MVICILDRPAVCGQQTSVLLVDANFRCKGSEFLQYPIPPAVHGACRLWSGENSILSLILGGAAVHRCDKRPVFSAGFKPLRATLACTKSFSANTVDVRGVCSQSYFGARCPTADLLRDRSVADCVSNLGPLSATSADLERTTRFRFPRRELQERYPAISSQP
jgi:hypothetical protein